MEKKILLIDDNIVANNNYIERLKSIYDVEAVSYINTALYKLKHPERYLLIIVDIMMPTLGIFTNKETHDGLTTGLVLYEKKIKAIEYTITFLVSS